MASKQTVLDAFERGDGAADAFEAAQLKSFGFGETVADGRELVAFPLQLVEAFLPCEDLFVVGQVVVHTGRAVRMVQSARCDPRG